MRRLILRLLIADMIISTYLANVGGGGGGHTRTAIDNTQGCRSPELGSNASVIWVSWDVPSNHLISLRSHPSAIYFRCDQCRSWVKITHLSTHSLTQSLTNSNTNSNTHSLAHLLTHSLTHSNSHSLTHPLTHSQVILVNYKPC